MVWWRKKRLLGLFFLLGGVREGRGVGHIKN